MTENQGNINDDTTKAATPETARSGPPIQLAEEVLDQRGQQTLALIKNAFGTNIINSGGRDDLPWVSIPLNSIVEIAEKCRDSSDLQMDMLHCLFAVDYVEHIELNYILFSIQNGRKMIIKTNLNAQEPSINSITHLWDAAAWYEREAHDLFGVFFEGNNDLEPLLLFEGFQGHPGLKSFPLHDYEEY